MYFYFHSTNDSEANNPRHLFQFINFSYTKYHYQINYDRILWIKIKINSQPVKPVKQQSVEHINASINLII